MDSIRDLWNGLDGVVTTTISAVFVFLVAIVAERVFVRLLRRAYWRRVDRAASAREVSELTRVKRQKTLVTLLESLVRYGVYGAAIIVVIGLVSGGSPTAFIGASVVAVALGFGLQRILGDVIAGALLLFEGHFAVGDVVTVHQHNVTGTVEEFSLRTTALRTLGGDRVTVMNGGMISFTRWSHGQRQYRIELVVRGRAAAERVADVCAAESASAGSLWLRPPVVDSTESFDEDLVRVYVTAVVAPSQEVLVERLVALLEDRVGEGRLIGPVTTVPLWKPTFDTWRAGLLARE